MAVGVRLVSILEVRTFFRKEARAFIYRYDKIRIVIADLLLAVVTQLCLTNHSITDPRSAFLHVASAQSGRRKLLSLDRVESRLVSTLRAFHSAS